MSTTVGAHSGAGPLSLMSCVRESSPLQDYEPDIEKNVVSKRKFWNPKKWFRKKQKTGDDTAVSSHHQHHQEQRDADGSRSRSTGELSTDEEPSRSHEGSRNSTSMHPGLSVSHDSVFHPLNSGSSDLELDGAGSSSSLSISQPLGDAKLQTELSSRLRLRRGRGDTSEDDEGLPRSPLCGSPAAATDSFLILEKTANNKDLPTKSHSTCSDGSLLSMDSSEMDEDSVGLQSRHSSKVSLNEKRTEQESDLELGPSFSSTPLNHSAAHHRVSVRPKRTYGVPRRKKGQLSSALPATPEVNEDSSIRSVSPESITTEPITELYSSTARHQHHLQKTSSQVSREVKLKCNSLPAGATPPTSESLRLISRSKSNAGKSQDDGSVRGEEREQKLSLFERLFPRRSGRKKKKDEMREKEERIVERIVQEEKMAKMEVDGDIRTRVNEERKTVQIHSTTPTSTKIYTEAKAMMSSHSHTKREDTKPTVAPRTGAAARQRIQPIDIPATPKEVRGTTSSSHPVPISPITPERSFSPGTSPIQMELENLLRHRQMTSKEPLLSTPPQSPKSPKLSLSSATNASIISASTKEFSSSTSYYNRSTYAETRQESKISSEDIRSKIKIAGLSSLQQRVLSLNSVPGEDYLHKSLTDFPMRLSRPLSKSHSFKTQKSSSVDKPLEEELEDVSEKRKSVTKASSLDSVKNLEEPLLKSELKLTLKPVQKAVEPEVEAEIEVAPVKTHLPEIVSHSYKKKIGTPEHEKAVSTKTHEVNPNVTSSPIIMALSPLQQVEQKDTTKLPQSPVDEEEKPKVSDTSSTYSSSTIEEYSVKTSNEQATVVPKSFSANSITISGPSHTAIVNVTSKSEDFGNSSLSSESEVVVDKDGVKKLVYKENQVSVTKIQLKHETTQVTKTTVTVPKPDIPEFLNKQLNKVEARPTSNIVFSMKSPKVSPEEVQNARPKTLFNFPDIKTQLPRKFSKEDVEIIEKPETKEIKDVSPPKTPSVVTTPTTPTQPKFKKNDSKSSSRKSSVISVTPDSPPVKESSRDQRVLQTRSISLDSLKGEDKSSEAGTPDKSSQDSLDKRSSTDGVVLRRKSFVKQKNEDEPELMKVFARRSLKLKDGDVDQLQEAIADAQRQRDSDKENDTETTPEFEKKLVIPKEERPSLIENVGSKPPASKEESKPHKQPLTEIKKPPEFLKNVAKDEPEVQLRRSLNNNIFLATQRAVSLNSPKPVINDFHIKKQASLNERRKTEQWINAPKKEDSIEEKLSDSEIISTTLTTKTEEVRTETKKNFSQRRAEWEKRAQAQK